MTGRSSTTPDHVGGNRPHRPWRRAALASAAVAATVGLLGAACSKSSTPDSASTATTVNEGTPTPGGKLVMAVTAETNGWNPGLAQWADAGNFVGGSVLEPLVTFDNQGNYVNWLAESVEPTTPNDFTAWTIKVRPGITFHDGRPLDAQAVKTSLDVYRGSHYTDATALSSIVLKDSYRDVVVKDPMTVQVTLARPWSAFPANLAGPSGYIMAPSMVDAPDKGVSKPVGTGPFVFDSWVPDASFRARKYTSYWKKDAAGNPQPYLDEVEFKPLPDNKQRLAALETGDVDMILTTQAADAGTAKSKYNVVTDYNGEKTMVMLNTAEDPSKSKNPFKNVHARRALAYATNRDAIQQLVGAGEDVAFSSAPQLTTSKWAMEESKTGYYPYDPAKAKQEIETYKQETGYPDFTFKFSGLANIEDQQVMQALQQQWSEVGIKAEIEVVEQQAYIGQVTLGGFQAAYFRNFAYIDPDSNYVFLHSSTAKGLGALSINFYQYKNADNDKALDTGASSGDFATRKAAYEESTRNINEAALNIWLFNTPYALIAQPNVRGLGPAQQNGFGNFLPKPWFWPGVWKQR